MKDARTHELLRQRVDSNDPLERVEAARALGRIADLDDLPRLERLLEDEDVRVRAEAVRRLSAWAPERWALWVEACVYDPDPGVRFALFEGAGEEASSWAYDIFAAGMEDEDPAVRAAAVRAVPFPEGAESVYLRMMEDPSVHVRVAAWERRIAAEATVRNEAMAWAFAQPGTEFPARALHALSAADASFFQEIEERLETARAGELLAAVEAVGRVGMESAVPPLLARMDRYDAWARQAACRSLSGFDLPGVRQALARRLVEDADFSVVRAAAEALSAHPSSQAVQVLASAARADRPRVRQWAVEALGVRADPAGIPAILARFQDSDARVREAAFVAIRHTDPDAARPERKHIRRAIRSSDTPEAASAIRLLGAMGDEEEIPFLYDRLATVRYDHPWQIREAALETLMALGVDTLVERAIELAAHRVVPPPPGEPDWTHDMDAVRMAALRYLARFGDPDLADALKENFSEVPPYPVRKELASLLTQWTGVRYAPMRGIVFPNYTIESLDPTGHLRLTPPGVSRGE